MAKRKTQHDPPYTDDGDHPSARTRRKGHRFDAAVAAEKERVQASIERESAEAEAAQKVAAEAEARRKLAQGKRNVEDAEAEVKASKKKAMKARLERWDVGYAWVDLEPQLKAQRKLEEAKVEAEAAEAEAVNKIAIARALAADLGHPNAVQDGGWTALDEKEQESLLEALGTACHHESVLRTAGFPVRRTRAPRPDRYSSPKKKVVALDCEFVGVTSCDYSVLAQLCAIDVLTGKILLDVLVDPGYEVYNYRTMFSGLNEQTFRRYMEKGLVLADAAAARDALFEFLGQDTILVGFSLHNDLQQLEMSHSRIVDFQLLAMEAVATIYGREVKRRWGLRHLCKELLGRRVQQSCHGHDCVEDAFAPRELLIWWLNSSNEELVREWVYEEARKKSNYYAGEFLDSLELWQESDTPVERDLSCLD